MYAGTALETCILNLSYAPEKGFSYLYKFFFSCSHDALSLIVLEEASYL